MTTLALTRSRRSVLAEALLPRAATRTGVTVLLGAMLTALAAQVTIPVPGSPVPVSGQTFAVLLTGAALGARRGAASQLLYLVMGAVGLPVSTDGANGYHAIFGATGGYLLGFVVAAGIAGAASRRGADRSPLRVLAVMATGSLVIYTFGAGWLAVATGTTLSDAVSMGVTPFVIGDTLKALLAAALLPATWRLVRLTGVGSQHD